MYSTNFPLKVFSNNSIFQLEFYFVSLQINYLFTKVKNVISINIYFIFLLSRIDYITTLIHCRWKAKQIKEMRVYLIWKPCYLKMTGKESYVRIKEGCGYQMIPHFLWVYPEKTKQPEYRNLTLRCFCVTIVTLEKQQVFHILNICP
jgi:hypothetical protein